MRDINLKGKFVRLFQRFDGAARLLWLVAVVASLQWSSFRASAQIVTLNNQNSSATINVGTLAGNSGGMTNWTVDGVNQLVQQWFWYRAPGMNSEQPINSIGAPLVVTPDGRTLYTTYANTQYSVEVDYMLTGTSPHSGTSDISEAIRISNTTASSLSFHLFQYSDFQLGGDRSHNIVQLGTDLRGLYNEADITKDNSGDSLSETVVSPGANHGEAALAPATFNKLTDGKVDTLNDNVGPTAPGDAIWAFEWDFTIGAGESVSISKDKWLHSTVPEPSTYALMSLGMAGFLFWRRKSVR